MNTTTALREMNPVYINGIYIMMKVNATTRNDSTFFKLKEIRKRIEIFKKRSVKMN